MASQNLVGSWDQSKIRVYAINGTNRTRMNQTFRRWDRRGYFVHSIVETTPGTFLVTYFPKKS